jgi:translation initiation factor IF-2
MSLPTQNRSLPDRSFVPPQGGARDGQGHLATTERQTRLQAIEHAREEQARRAQEVAEARLRAETEARRKEEEARREAVQATRQPVLDADREEVDRGVAGEDEDTEDSARKRSLVRGKGEFQRRQGRLTITQALENEGDRLHVRSLAAVRRQRERQKQRSREALQHGTEVMREVVIPEVIMVHELAGRMAERSSEVVKALMKLGAMATINQTIDADTAELVVAEFGHKARRVSERDIEIGLMGEADRPEDLEPRPPVVTVMGHVDHGKTSLLDALRKTDVAAHEAGGITQHIGAYQIEVKSGGRITFIDTPGHAAFTEMRARGANVTDIIVLVVAADDGVMAQTQEAINHAKAAKAPIIVAINKIDKPGADATRVKTDLLEHGLVPEEMGGDVMCVPVSAKTGQGLNDLVEAILLQAEILELKANPNRLAEGVIIESKMQQGRGVVVTVLLQRGTTKIGDVFVAGNEYGRVRALFNDRGNRVASGGPAEPLEVFGLNGTPEAGDKFVVVKDEQRAREVAADRTEKKRQAQLAAAGRGTLEQMLTRLKEGESKTVQAIIKSDVHGSREAIAGALERLSTEEVKINVLHAGVGGVNESDVVLACASGATIIAFNVRASLRAQEFAKRDGVDIRYYSIIYDVIDDMKGVMSGLLSPESIEKVLGYAEIREVFDISKVGKVAGCSVTDGLVRRGAKARLFRDYVVVHNGTIKGLRRFKDEAREVQQGYECGISFESYQDFRVGDRIECYEVREVARRV